MKAKPIFLTVLLLLMSIAIGWCLPSGAGAILDKKTENTVQTAKIEQVNLSYLQDLTIPDKLQAIFEGQFYGGDTIQSGIFLKKDEAEQIAMQFFADFWEQLTVADTRAYATPCMVRNAQGNGLVVWDVAIKSQWLNDVFVIIDDATGVILSFYLFTDTIARLEPEQSVLEEASTAFLNRFLSAYNRHLQAQNAALTCQCTSDEPAVFDQCYPLSLTAPDGSAVSSSLCIFFSAGELMFNQTPIYNEMMP